MKRNIIKILSICIILILSSVTFFSVISNAETGTEGEGGGDGYASQMKELIKGTNKVVEVEGATDTTRNIVATVIIAAKIIGVCVAIVMLLVVAMKYMSAAPSEKAEIKKSATVYVVGAIILFAVTGILTIIEQFASAITTQ